MTSILRYAFVFSASIVTATAPGLAAEPVETAIADLVSTVDAATDWSAAYRDLSYDSATDTAVLTGLTVENSVIGVEVNFQPISIVGYVEAPDGTFDARTISSDGASISNEGLAASIAAIRYDGLGNVPTDFSSFPAWDSQRPFTSMIRAYAPFVDIQLAHGEIGSISIDVKRPTSESSTS